MKLSNQKIYMFTILFLLTVLVPSLIYAQGPPPPPPPPPGGGPPCWPPPCIPINKGLVFLAISAFALAVYQLKLFRIKTK